MTRRWTLLRLRALYALLTLAAVLTGAGWRLRAPAARPSLDYVQPFACSICGAYFIVIHDPRGVAHRVYDDQSGEPIAEYRRAVPRGSA
jgi:hypothetical protein